jgi:hypothetical protein
LEIGVFIQFIQGKCNRPNDLRRLMDRWQAELGPSAPGWLGATYGFTEDGTSVAVVRFESHEKAMENSDKPEQAQWFNEVQKCYIGPLEFLDCDDVTTLLEGGSDSAGFVQIMRGRVTDEGRLKSLLEGRHADELHQARPEIIGATLAIAGDGQFVQTIAFTDEESARRGEQLDMPDEVRETLDASMADVTFVDLHAPWFSSRA